MQHSMLSLENIAAFFRSAGSSNDSRDDAYFNRLRKKEFARINKKRNIYLDYTGGCLYPASLVKAHQQFLEQAVFGNPHSTNPASLLSEKYISEAREHVLHYFNAPDYYCIFTSNASGALQIVGESY